MSRKDLLAAGQRTATFVGGVGDGVDLKKVSDEPRFEFTPEPAAAPKRKAFRPAGFTLLIRRAEATLGSGLLELPDNVDKEQPAEGLILNVGPSVTKFNVGDYVAFGKYSGTLFKLNGEELLLAQEDEMLGTIVDENPDEYKYVEIKYKQTYAPLDNNTNIGVCCSRFGVNGSPGFDSDGNRLEGKA
jgi:chaperonin GroES